MNSNGLTSFDQSPAFGDLVLHLAFMVMQWSAQPDIWIQRSEDK